MEDRHILMLRIRVSFVKIHPNEDRTHGRKWNFIYCKTVCHSDSKVHLGQILGLFLLHLQSRVDEMRV